MLLGLPPSQVEEAIKRESERENDAKCQREILCIEMQTRGRHMYGIGIHTHRFR
jgi:hypothetical protein